MSKNFQMELGQTPIILAAAEPETKPLELLDSALVPEIFA